jgi:sulfoxide reductase catalytic subunit YedY
MLIRIRKSYDIMESEITPKEVYLNRRAFMVAGALGAAGVLAPSLLRPPLACAAQKLKFTHNRKYSTDEKQNPFSDAAGSNNFYEFSSGKTEVAELAKGFKTRPWTVEVDGLMDKPQTFDIDSIIKAFPLEERVYRHRCVEAWSMVIPWVGFPLSDFIRKCGPTSQAKFVKFTTIFDPKDMPGQRRDVLPWPYVEGLRLDEAMNPLAIFAVGMYGEVLPPQNGAPLRLVTPWKYGFKGCKSIVKVEFTDTQPRNTWNVAAPTEYGFYANVNPHVDHPRWSQARERRIGEFFKRKTLMFNGYEEEVAYLYKGMDLRKNF